MKRTWELVAVPAVNDLARRLYIDDEAVESDADESDTAPSLHEDAPEPDCHDAPIDGFDRRSSSSLSSCNGGSDLDSCDSDVADMADRILDPSRNDPEWRSAEEDEDDSLDGFIVPDKVRLRKKPQGRLRRPLFSDDGETSIMTPEVEETASLPSELPTLEEFLDFDEKCRGSCVLPDGLGGETEIIPLEKWEEAEEIGDGSEETRFLCKGSRRSENFMVISKTERRSDVERIRRASGEADIIELPVKTLIVKHSLVPLKSLGVDIGGKRATQISLPARLPKRKVLRHPPIRSKMRKLVNLNSRLHARELKLARLGGYVYQFAK